MIDPSSSEEEGDEDAVINLGHKGRIGGQNKSVTSSIPGPGPGPGSSSSSVAVIPPAAAGGYSKSQNGDFSGNQRISNANAGNGAAKSEQPPQSALNEGANLGIPSNGITRFV